MHELSIAQAIVEGVQETADREKATRVLRVRLRVGQLSGVVADSLRFCYDLVVAGTCMEGSHLEIVELPVMVHCQVCQADRALDSIQLFACPVCGTPSGDIRQGRELEIESIEIDSPEGPVVPDAVESVHGSPNR
jgi:hydrogenase nickel incorporation protein HypA/HybF